MKFPSELEKRLGRLIEKSSYRQLVHRKGVDFSSNDYLGFSQDPVLRQRALEALREFQLPLGASASRLLRGQLPVFEEAERELSDFCGRESALLFPTGYQANVGLLSALLRPEDVVFSDQFNHASLIDGVRLSGARKQVYPHLDLAALRSLLEAERNGNALKIILTESIFSMDGDQAPLKALAGLAEEFEALLIVDEAHATGVFGDFSGNRGGGCVQALGLSDRVFASVHPGGKAMGLGGAWVCGSERLKEYLVNFSRSFIFSTAPLPVLPLWLQTSVEYWKEVGRERAQAVLSRARGFERQLGLPELSGLIIPVVVGSNDAAIRLSQTLQAAGYDVRAIRPPTVPEGTARLRITLQWGQTPEQVEGLVSKLRELL